ncbi:MAG TPA: GspE/PulE family protein [Candidatus Paceibacterota bacterium]|nr:GspE/PulE family protein [Candidatus Paceibacterota bacterium]
MGGLHAFIPTSRRVREEPAALSVDGVGISTEAPTNVDLFIQADRSVIRLVELLIECAHAARASDVHLDPSSDLLCIRWRVDGALADAYTLPRTLHAEVISRIKILSGLRIDEHYGAQDGRFRLQLATNVSVDVRVSIAPTYYGENAVLRLLSDGASEFSLDSLGFTGHDQDVILQALAHPYGMILATGPTGSGKTTTMYTLVQMLNQPDISIITLEDPIEYSIPRVRQIQINPKSGLTFGSGLRSMLRQDPDVIMVGEIRDEETAGLAVNTALTGHRVLSTLHTNDAPTTVTRLLDMGVEPYLIASTMSLAIGSRLVRRICAVCKTPKALDDHEMLSISTHVPPEILGSRPQFFLGAGCNTCDHTGFRGRAGLHEVMAVTGAVRDAIVMRLPAGEIRRIAIENGMVPLLADGFRKAAQGITSIAEVLKLRYE